MLYIQVGIGNGNASNTIQGDYNFWFLPQAEDRLNVQQGGNPGPTAYYVKYRPVFDGRAAGQADQPGVRRAGSPPTSAWPRSSRPGPAGRARGTCWRWPAASTRWPRPATSGKIVTTFPNDYYGGTEWKSDMLWGAAEIALADEALHAPAARLRADLRTASRWARAYIAQGHPAGGDTLNLYDNGALGEGELLRALQQAGPGGRPAAGLVTRRALLADLAAQLRLGERRVGGDPFGLGTQLGGSDATPHAFGLYITNALYQQYGGGGQFAAFAQQQLNFALGANGWGTTFVVGAGRTFPHCMQSEIANLAGSLTGTGRIQLGAVTDGPSSPSNFAGPRHRERDAGVQRRASSARSTPPAAQYEDNVVGLAVGRARRRLHRELAARVRVRGRPPQLASAGRGRG